MEDLAALLTEHYVNHPAMEVRDAVKFLHQSCMGPGHLIPEEGAALARLEEEWSELDGDAAARLSEPLGNGLCRLQLNACKGVGLSAKTLNRLFYLTAQEFVPRPSDLEEALHLILSLPLPPERAAAYLARYRAQGCPMERHSPAYRAAYLPAYRVVFSYYVNFIPLLAAIDRALAGDQLVRVAIDGPCASGKSTLGRRLAQVYRCPLVHMDDFFLQPHQRTQARLEQPGGNVDYERFDREVLSPLCQGEDALCRPWRCASGAFGPGVIVPAGPLTVVEGVYSLRSDLRDRFTLRVWLEASWETRRQRLLERGGPACLERFETLWIPLEDRYFSACGVKACCHFTLSGDSA